MIDDLQLTSDFLLASESMMMVLQLPYHLSAILTYYFLNWDNTFIFIKILPFFTQWFSNLYFFSAKFSAFTIPSPFYVKTFCWICIRFETGWQQWNSTEHILLWITFIDSGPYATLIAIYIFCFFRLLIMGLSSNFFETYGISDRNSISKTHLIFICMLSCQCIANVVPFLKA